MPNPITILRIAPGKKPETITIPHTLESLQAQVGGDIEAHYPYEDLVAIVCHGEGRIIGLPMNRYIGGEDNYMEDIICGTFLIVGLSEDNFDSLPQDLLEKYMKKFRYLETLRSMAGLYGYAAEDVDTMIDEGILPEEIEAYFYQMDLDLYF